MNGVSSCGECGASVADVAAHSRWHARQIARIAVAARSTPCRRCKGSGRQPGLHNLCGRCGGTGVES